jgi:hypothetical protein
MCALAECQSVQKDAKIARQKNDQRSQHIERCDERPVPVMECGGVLENP